MLTTNIGEFCRLYCESPSKIYRLFPSFGHGALQGGSWNTIFRLLRIAIHQHDEELPKVIQNLEIVCLPLAISGNLHPHFMFG